MAPPTADTLTRIFEIAQDQEGYFTMRQAVEAGIKPTTIVQAARRGSKIERRSRGVYRLKLFPSLSNNAHLWEAILWPQVGAHIPASLSHVTALRMHDLSDANPAQVHITIPRASRIDRTAPKWLAIHRADLESFETQFIDGLPATTVERTLIDIARSAQDSALLEAAIRDARKRDLNIPPQVLSSLAFK